MASSASRSVGSKALEVNFLGLVAGLDIREPALKLPGFGRIGLPSSTANAALASSSSEVHLYRALILGLIPRRATSSGQRADKVRRAPTSPVLSIIVPVLNEAKTITDALQALQIVSSARRGGDRRRWRQ